MNNIQNLTIAFNFVGDMIIKDRTGKRHVFQNEEMELIKSALYSYAQKGTSGIYYG